MFRFPICNILPIIPYKFLPISHNHDLFFQEYCQTKIHNISKFIPHKTEGLILNESYAEFSTAGALDFLIPCINKLVLKDSLQRH